MNVLIDEIIVWIADCLECEEFGRLLVCSHRLYTVLKAQLPEKQVYYHLYNEYSATYFNLKEIADTYPTPLQAVRTLGWRAVSSSWCKVAVSSFPYKDFVEVNGPGIEHARAQVPRVNVDAYVIHELQTLDLSVLTPQIHHRLLKLQYADNHPRNRVPF